MSVDTKRVRQVAEDWKREIPREIYDELNILADEVKRLEGFWKDEHDRCPQCGTGNPKVAQLRAEVERLENDAKAHRVLIKKRLDEREDIWLPLLEAGKKVRLTVVEPKDWVEFGEAIDNAQRAMRKAMKG